MRLALRTVEIVGTTALLLGLAAAPASGSSLGEVTAATGVHGTLARGGGSSGSGGALKSAKSSLAKSTKPRDYDGAFGSKSTRSKPTASRSRGSRGGGGSSRGSWVTASSAGRGGRGGQSSAWLQGGNGWSSGGRR